MTHQIIRLMNSKFHFNLLLLSTKSPRRASRQIPDFLARAMRTIRLVASISGAEMVCQKSAPF
jgi:hypothetical protein